MTGQQLKEALRKADIGGYAIPSFNYSDIWDFIAIVEAAEEENAPVMIASNPLVVKAISVEICGAIGKAAMEKAKIPLCHHLDHSFDVELCIDSIDNGYPSVMIDASKYNLETNVAMVKEVVDYAHIRGVAVEGEIGRIKGKGIEGDFTGGDFLAQPADAAELVAKTGLDSLAVGVGTAHGFYVNKPEINFERLKEINDVVDVPLVLHGGTGVPEGDIKRAIQNGINKVNVGTIIHCTYMNSMRKELDRLGDNQYTLDIVKPVITGIKQVVKSWIRVCGINGKA